MIPGSTSRIGPGSNYAELRRTTRPRQVEIRRPGPGPISDASGVTKTSSFPTPAELADRTPADRDRAIDVIRITALIGVVVGHTVMAASIIRNHVLIWDNLLTTSPDRKSVV